MKLPYAVGLVALLLVPTSQVTAQDQRSKSLNQTPLATVQLDPGKCHFVFGVVVCTLEIAQGNIILNIDPKSLQSLTVLIK